MNVRIASTVARGYLARISWRKVTYLAWKSGPDTPWLLSLVPRFTTTTSAAYREKSHSGVPSVPLVSR